MDYLTNHDPVCPLHREGKCEEIKRLRKRIAELEMQVVRTEAYDDPITESRVFRIKFSELLDPNEAMDIFVRNVERIIRKQAEKSGLFK